MAQKTHKHAYIVLTVCLCLSRIAQPSQVYYTGEVKGEAAMKTESEIGTAITHQIRVSTGQLRKKVISLPERLDLFQHFWY